MNLEEEPIEYIPNHLALTVRKDYKLTIARNIVNAAKRVSCKISLSILLLNFLNIII